MDMFSYGQISAGNLSAITTLPDELQDEIFKIAHHYTEQMKLHQEEIRQQALQQIVANKPKIPRDQNSRVTMAPTTTEDGDLENVYSV
jgi:ribosome recycling factor